ncbi:MAG: HAMP domain-containing sensor histidine kinase, partial [Chloroflexi bacterium]|nr:HAMP domain-containing sensor histidine kinase [Chloroflexota bacterium]
ASTFRDGDLVRLRDVRAAARGRPDGRSPGTVPAKLSLRSYLAVPVIGRSAEILGALVFGHEKLGVFAERDERVAAAIAGQAAIAIENARLYEEAQRAIEVREQFLGIASHELRTPLTVLRGYAQLLQRQIRRGSLDLNQLPGVVEHLVESADRLNRLINELLDTSRLQRGRLDLHREPADLVSVAALVLERFEDVPERTPAHSLVLDAPAPVVGRWDVGRVDQVLTTVVDSAVKYSPDGGEVRVSVRRLDHHAEITVSDQGIGIDASDHAAVFQPFQRVCEDKRVTSGHGLGLYIAEQIVRRHGGTITLDSTPGAGSRFTVSLPVDAKVSADDAPRRPASTGSAPS